MSICAHLFWYLASLQFLFCSAQLPLGFQLPSTLNTLLSGLGGTYSLTSTNGTNIGVRINGLQNLTPTQQQAFINALGSSFASTLTSQTSLGFPGTNSLSPFGTNSLSPFGTAGTLGGLPYGLNLGNYLGTSGLAASAAQAFANPYGLFGSNSLSGLSQPGLSTSPFGTNGQQVFLPGGVASQQLNLAALGALLQGNGAISSVVSPSSNTLQVIGYPVYSTG